MPIKNILVVDDSATDRQFLSDLLMKNGYKVITAQNADEALAKAKELHPDLVLMDIVMPGQSGFQATRALSRDSETSAIPVVIVSTKGMDTDRAWGMRQGAKGYLVKPPSEQDLIGQINELLGA